MCLNPNLLLAIPLLPLAAAMIAGLFCRVIPRPVAHWTTILGVAASFLLSARVAYQVFFQDAPVYNAMVYQWLVSDGVGMQVGFLVDELTASGKVRAGSGVGFGRIAMGVAARAGSRPRDVGSVEAFVRELKGAGSIAYAVSPKRRGLGVSEAAPA